MAGEEIKPCVDCGTTEPSLHYKSGKMDRCYDCQRYKNLTTKKTGGGVEFSREEYLDWVRADPERRNCTYRGNDTNKLYSLDITNPRNKKRFESVGLDRRDNAKSYTIENLVPCCAPCNAMRSSILTHEEMLQLGPHVAGIWDARLSLEEPTEGD